MNIEDLERERAERKEALAEARKGQRLEDLTRVNELEIEHGDENVAVIDIDRYSPGIVTLGVVRCLRKAELKRYRDRIRGDNVDHAAAAEEAAGCALLYPPKDSELWRLTLELVPGVATRFGVAAVHLAAGIERAEGKK
jgi:hypothetical protein